jgi:hypothetical protein
LRTPRLSAKQSEKMATEIVSLGNSMLNAVRLSNKPLPVVYNAALWTLAILCAKFRLDLPDIQDDFKAAFEKELARLHPKDEEAKILKAITH